jgi:hypothetical protein
MLNLHRVIISDRTLKFFAAPRLALIEWNREAAIVRNLHARSSAG